MTCFECGATATEKHHVIPRSLGGTRTVALCGSCHGKVHRMARADDISSLTSRSLQKKKKRGERVGAIPYGSALAPDGVHLVDDESEQDMLTLANHHHAAGMSLRAVAAELIRAGHQPRRGRTFSASQVKRMLVTS